MLVISPTRELAAQIAEEAKQITAFQPNFRVQVRLCGLLCSQHSAHRKMKALASLRAQKRCLSVQDGEQVSRVAFQNILLSSQIQSAACSRTVSQGAVNKMAGS